VCGDSNCVGTYQFIGKGTGIGRKGQKITYAEAYQSFKRSLTSVINAHSFIPNSQIPLLYSLINPC